jgi:hypothetical protein
LRMLAYLRDDRNGSYADSPLTSAKADGPLPAPPGYLTAENDREGWNAASPLRGQS